MTTRSTPRVIPTFGAPSNNQQYTSVFDTIIVDKKNVSGVKGERGGAKQIPEESKSKKPTNLVMQNLSKNQYSERTANDQKGFQDDQSKQLKAKDYMEMKSANANSKENANTKGSKKAKSYRYRGRLGNPLSSQSQRPSEKTVHPNTKHGSATPLANENPANDMKFGAWEHNPNVPITQAFEAYKKGTSLNGGRQGTVPHTIISNDVSKTPSWWSRFTPKKWRKRLFG